MNELKLPLSTELVTLVKDSYLEPLLVRSVRDEIRLRRGTLDQEVFFSTLSTAQGSAKGYWSRGLDATRDRIKEPRAFVKFLRLLKPAIEIDVRTEPWNRWDSHRSRVIVVVGKREVSIPEVSAHVKQRAVGARDSEAFAELSRILYRDLGLDCEILLEHVPARMPRDEAVALMDRWRKDAAVGMICVLGSPVVNPLANVIARDMLRDDPNGEPEECPAKFRWAFKVSPDNFLADRAIKGGKEMWGPDEEGIAFPNRPTGYPRVGDDVVLKRFARQQTFKDAGLFMIDSRQPPILVLCAGHGGCGTLGSVRQLREKDLIGDLLDASRSPSVQLSDCKPGRLVAIVEVNRRKTRKPQHGSSNAIDDLEIASSQMVWASVDLPERPWG